MFFLRALGVFAFQIHAAAASCDVICGDTLGPAYGTTEVQALQSPDSKPSAKIVAQSGKYLAPESSSSLLLFRPPQTSIDSAHHTARWLYRAWGALLVVVALHSSVAGE